MTFYNVDEVVPFKQYLYRYPTPYAASESSSPLWYAVRRASAHIIVLSSYSPFGNLPLYLCIRREGCKRTKRSTNSS
ncbi:putative Acid phosphatase [Helianthus annuus]|nr:putative Acid phosphatase [Helianthus annuus]